jgi:hypothetical protein
MLNNTKQLQTQVVPRISVQSNQIRKTIISRIGVNYANFNYIR